MKRPTAQEYKKHFSTPTGMALLGYYMLTALVGMFIPSDILTANAWAREFSDFMASIVPQIDRITALGIKSDINRFYFSLMWAMSPIFIFLIFLDALTHKNSHPAWSAPLNKLFLTIVVAVCLIFATNNAYWMDIATNYQANQIIQFYLGNGLGRGFVANTMYIVAPVYIAGGCLVLIYGWLSGHIPRNINKQAARQKS